MLIFFIWFIFCLPKPLFHTPTSTVLVSEQGELLGAKIADDGQWRFPPTTAVPEKFAAAIITYEDQQFYKHLGINPVAIIQAAKANMKAGEIKRGGSTITQQTIRLSRKNPPRTYWEKGKEAIFATRLELGSSKQHILALYSSHAPFGGNVVGIDAAAWRYFGRNAQDLSWAEAATLAVLPNAPGLIHPGRNRNQLEEKRNQLLAQLQKTGKLDAFTYELAIQEPLPLQPLNLPRHAPHMLDYAEQEHRGEVISTSLSLPLQTAASRIVNQHHQSLKQNRIHNAAAIIIDVRTKQVKAYIGNTETTASYQDQVDVVQAQRSTGSLLKPFLYAASLDKGEFLPHTLIADIPTYYNNYTPQNFNKTFSGAAPADQALATSLNVPAVRMLNEYGIPTFHNVLQNLHLNGVKYKPSHYGLPLILGGAESSLWELCRAYAGMASTLNHFAEQEQYFKDEYAQLSIYATPIANQATRKQYDVFSAASIWHTMNALVEAKRPGEKKAWEYFSSSQKLAWKTGTSYGNKDAWAIGVNPNYVVGVWVGNADGEGRTGNTGLQTAAPILFDLVDMLPPSNEWFSPPVSELYQATVCKQSGQLVNRHCPNPDTLLINQIGLQTKPCAYHQLLSTTKNGEFLVNQRCAEPGNITQTAYFVLPPKQALFYAKHTTNYKPLPPTKPGCTSQERQNLSIIYPQSMATISIPTNIQGQPEKLVARVTHKEKNARLYWYLNHAYLGSTKSMHQMELAPKPGKHLLGITDEHGEQVFRYFTVK